MGDVIRIQRKSSLGGPVIVTDNVNPSSPISVNPGGSYTCFAAAVQSGIAYDRPVRGEVISYETYDAAWQNVNNPQPTPPAFPIHYAKLDDDAVSPYITLIDNNDFGNKDRFTNSLGLTTSYDGTGGELVGYKIDNLTGYAWTEETQGVKMWVDFLDDGDALVFAGFSDWFAPSASEVVSVYGYEPLIKFLVGDNDNRLTSSSRDLTRMYFGAHVHSMDTNTKTLMAFETYYCRYHF